MKCLRCGKEMSCTFGGNYTCECGAAVNDLVFRPQTLTPALGLPIEATEDGTSCQLCGGFVRSRVPTICEDCKTLWKKLKKRFVVKKWDTVVSLTKKQDLLGYYGRVLDVKHGEALIEFSIGKGERVVTWLNDGDYAGVE